MFLTRAVPMTTAAEGTFPEVAFPEVAFPEAVHRTTSPGGRAVPAPLSSESNDQAEFERLYRRWRPEVLSLCRRLLGRPDDAEDAAQEAFLRAWVARDRFLPVMPFWPWLATIAHRLCVDERRRTVAHLVGDGAFFAVETTPEDRKSVV